MRGPVAPLTLVDLSGLEITSSGRKPIWTGTTGTSLAGGTLNLESSCARAWTSQDVQALCIKFSRFVYNPCRLRKRPSKPEVQWVTNNPRHKFELRSVRGKLTNLGKNIGALRGVFVSKVSISFLMSRAVNVNATSMFDSTSRCDMLPCNFDAGALRPEVGGCRWKLSGAVLFSLDPPCAESDTLLSLSSLSLVEYVGSLFGQINRI